MGLISEMIAVQSELKCPKNRTNNFAGYKFRNAEDIEAAAKPICAAHGLLLNISDKVEIVGSRYYVHVTAKVLNGDGETLSSDGFAREQETKKGLDESQITGTASSYARKYALQGLFCLDDTEDADSMDNREQPYTREQQGRYAKIGELKRKFIAAGGKEEGLRSFLEANFKRDDGTPKPMAEFSDYEIKAVEAHFATLVRDMEEIRNASGRADA